MRLFSCKYILPLPKDRLQPSLVSTLIIFSTLIFGISSANGIDASFGSNGILIVDFGGSYDVCKAIRIQSDGKIVVGGWAGEYGSYDFAMIRCDSNGSMDTSFGNNGKVRTDLGYSDMLNDLAIQSDGKLVAVGESNDDIVIVRYNTNGSVDTTFGTNGKTVVDIGEYDQAYAVAIQNDGKILIGGASYSSPEFDREFVIVRIDSSGVLDGNFNFDGIVTTDLGGNWEWISGIICQADGKIIATGTGNDSIAAVRYNTDGSVDLSFGSNGFASAVPGQGYEGCLQSDGKVIVPGQGSNWTEFKVVRYNNDGSLDTSFGTEGTATVPLDLNVEGGQTIVLSDGKIIVGSGEGFLAVRLNDNGAVDTEFGVNGIVSTDFGWGEAIAIQDDDKIIVVGENDSGNWAAVRYSFISSRPRVLPHIPVLLLDGE